jgi:hypothetical protein
VVGDAITVHVALLLLGVLDAIAIGIRVAGQIDLHPAGPDRASRALCARIARFHLPRAARWGHKEVLVTAARIGVDPAIDGRTILVGVADRDRLIGLRGICAAGGLHHPADLQ